MLDWDFVLDNIISVILTFNDILFALSQAFSSFKPWLMCPSYKSKPILIELTDTLNWCLTDI